MNSIIANMKSMFRQDDSSDVDHLAQWVDEELKDDILPSNPTLATQWRDKTVIPLLQRHTYLCRLDLLRPQFTLNVSKHLPTKTFVVPCARLHLFA